MLFLKSVIAVDDYQTIDHKRNRKKKVTHKLIMRLMSAIDNLIKGQAGQGVQCLNLMAGLAPETGLPLQSFYP